METRRAVQPVDLREEVCCVRESILSYVVRMDDILLQQIPQIRADYALKIGCWEQAPLEAELAGRRARRRLQLAQAQANQGVEANMDAIEGQLDAELAEWMAKVEQARLTYKQTLAYLTAMIPMGKKETAELKRTYRILVKRLHPDVHAGDDEEHESWALEYDCAFLPVYGAHADVGEPRFIKMLRDESGEAHSVAQGRGLRGKGGCRWGLGQMPLSWCLTTAASTRSAGMRPTPSGCCATTLPRSRPESAPAVWWMFPSLALAARAHPGIELVNFAIV